MKNGLATEGAEAGVGSSVKKPKGAPRKKAAAKEPGTPTIKKPRTKKAKVAEDEDRADDNLVFLLLPQSSNHSSSESMY